MSNTVTNTGWNPVQATTTYAQNAYSSATTAASNFATAGAASIEARASYKSDRVRLANTSSTVLAIS